MHFIHKSASWEKYFKSKHILCREILGENFVCTYIEENFKIDRSLYIALHCNSDFDCKYVSAILAFYFRYTNNEFDTLFSKMRVAEFKRLPIKLLHLKDQRPFIQKADIILGKNKELNQLSQQFTHLLQTKFSALNINNKLQS
ncbi:TaqI-like C-terminal specificity domain-containing protein [Ilyomonas limi]|uniref:TaqI-like C-terminal specificity domain-containing protein n=1 Tax=Ilyomonas limi TaxID=2575867 RepID=UPI0037431889